MISVGIVGGSGYTGAELLRLCAGHPEFDVQLATGDSQAGTKVADLYPSLAASYGDLTFTKFSAEACTALLMARVRERLRPDAGTKGPAAAVLDDRPHRDLAQLRLPRYRRAGRTNGCRGRPVPTDTGAVWGFQPRADPASALPRGDRGALAQRERLSLRGARRRSNLGEIWLR